jgi:hypothetical protein
MLRGMVETDNVCFAEARKSRIVIVFGRAICALAARVREVDDRMRGF